MYEKGCLPIFFLPLNILLIFCLTCIYHTWHINILYIKYDIYESLISNQTLLSSLRFMWSLKYKCIHIELRTIIQMTFDPQWSWSFNEIVERNSGQKKLFNDIKEYNFRRKNGIKYKVWTFYLKGRICTMVTVFHITHTSITINSFSMDNEEPHLNPLAW